MCTYLIYSCTHTSFIQESHVHIEYSCTHRIFMYTYLIHSRISVDAQFQQSVAARTFVLSLSISLTCDVSLFPHISLPPHTSLSPHISLLPHTTIPKYPCNNDLNILQPQTVPKITNTLRLLLLSWDHCHTSRNTAKLEFLFHIVQMDAVLDDQT